MKKNRFQIKEKSSGSSDHFYSPDLRWKVIDTDKSETIKSFYGRWDDNHAIQKVKFSRDKKEVIAYDGNGEIVERFKLPD